MNSTLISIAAFLLLLLISVVWALIRGVTKARIRFICVLLCAVAAFAITVAAKNNIKLLYERYEPQIEEALSESMVEVLNFVSNSENVREVITASGGAILAPIAFVVLFIALQLITWIIYFIVTLILRHPIKNREERRRLRPLRAMAYGIVQFVIILFVFTTPLFSYLQLAPALVHAASNANAIPANVQEAVNEENVAKMNKSPVLTVYGKLGGSQINKALTKMKIQGETTYLADEINAIVSLTDDFATLKNAGDIENWKIEQAEAIRSLSTSLADSKIIASLIGDVVRESTEKWLAEEKFIGMEKPSVGEYFDPAFELLLQDLNRDSKSLTAISDDLKTIGDLIYILVRDGAIPKLKDSNGIATLLANGGTIKSMIDVLNANENLKNLVSEMTKFGMKAVGNMFELPEVETSDYKQFFNEVTDKVNEVLETIDFTSEESVKDAIGDLTEKVQTELEQANVTVELSDEIIDIYSDIIIQEFKDKEGPVTVEELKELFGIVSVPSSENGGE